MASIVQRSLAGGEIGPPLYARTDIVKYQTGLRTLRNFLLMKHGGAQNRPGTIFIGEVKDSTQKIREIPFEFNNDQTYNIEFGNKYFRFIKGDSYILEASNPITGVVSGPTTTLDVTGHGYVDGNEVYISGVEGMTELNGRNFKVQVVDADHFLIKYMDGSDVDSSSFGVYTGSGTVARVYEIVTPYLQPDLSTIHFVQSADVLTLVHPNYAPRNLNRFADDNWTLTVISFDPSISPPSTPSTLGGAGGLGPSYYVVTAVDEKTSEESLPSVQASSANIATSADPITIAWGAVSGASQYYVYRVKNGVNAFIGTAVGTTFVDDGITPDVTDTAPVANNPFVNRSILSVPVTAGGAGYGSAVNGKINSIAVVAGGAGYLAGGTGTFALGIADTAGVGATATVHVTAGVVTSVVVGAGGSGYIEPTFSITDAAGVGAKLLASISPADSSDVELIVTDSTGEGATVTPVIVAGAITSVTVVTAGNNYTAPAVSVSVAGGGSGATFGDPVLLDGTDNFPSTVNYIQQRLTLANLLSDTEAVFMSRSGQFYNFTKSIPIQQNDTVKFRLAGKKVNAVKHIVDVGKMVLLTSTGEWFMNGDGSGTITPTQLNPQQSSYYGCSDLQPVQIGGTALFVQARGSIIRDIAFNWQTQGYSGNDLTIFAPHLFENHTIVDWDYQQIPNSIVWAVRDDGVLLGLTYIKEQEIWGWHRHDFTDAFIENVCCIPNGEEDAVYLTVRRTIGGVTKRYVEKMASRIINDVRDNIFCDSALTYDGRGDGVTTISLVGSGWTHSDTITMNASASTFATEDEGKTFFFYSADGKYRARMKVNFWLNDTTVTAIPEETVPDVFRTGAQLLWARGASVVSGLWHLEGETVAVQGDSFVFASPFNSSYTQIVVENGKVTIDRPAGVIHVGKPFISDIETLNIDTANGETIADKDKHINMLSAFVYQTRGFFSGSMPPEKDPKNTTQDPLYGLYETKVRFLEGYDFPVDLKDEVIKENIQSSYNDNGRVFIRNVDPNPCSILSIIPAGDLPNQRSA